MEYLMFITVLVALFYLIIGSIEDIKTREVMDYSNFSLVALGFSLNLFYSLIFNEWNIILQSIAGFVAALIISYAMYYSGQWGGGDSKMLMGLGALFGIPLSFKTMPFLADFLLNTLIFGAFYGMIWSIVLTVKNGKKVKDKIIENLKRYRTPKRIVLISALVLSLSSFITTNPVIKMMMLFMAFLVIFSFYLWLFVKSIEKVNMYKRIAVDKLTEGDWIAEEVKVKGKLICGPKDLGISKEQIEILKNAKLKDVLVKEGIPFVPSFLIAYIFVLIVPGFWFGLMP